MHKRYLSDKPQRFQEYIQAAKDYVANVGEANRNYVYIKPYDPTPGNPMLYQNLYDTLSLIQAMNIRPGGRVLDAGCGSGWLSEILFGMGFSVDGIDPSEDFVAIARERTQAFAQHHRLNASERLRFHAMTLEECTLPDGAFDGIIFYAALHHVVDEQAGIAQCFRLLKPGGVLGVHEAAWIPGNAALEAGLEREMADYGTLENPFTVEYLDSLLKQAGFENITRYHQVNGLFPVSKERLTLRQATQALAENMNVLTAMKPFGVLATTGDPDANARLSVELLNTRFEAASRQLFVSVRVTNTGDVVLLGGSPDAGRVALALRQGDLGDSMREALNRVLLPHSLTPHETITLNEVFTLPEGFDASAPWLLDAVNEQYYWFSLRGFTPVEVRLS